MTGKQLRIKLKKLGISQSQLSVLTGYKIKTIYSMGTGERKVSDRIIAFLRNYK